MNDTKTSPRDRILSTADRLFYEHGFRATGISELIREAEVAKASFYDHFTSKEALAVAYLEARNDRWMTAFRVAIGKSSAARRRFVLAFEFLDQWLPTVGFRGCAFANLSAEFPDDGPVRRLIVSHKREVRESFHEIVENANCKPAEAKRIASTGFLLFEGAITQAEINRNLDPIRQAIIAAKSLSSTL